MVELRFFRDSYGYFDEKSEKTIELTENYTGVTWEECCEDCVVNSLDWHDDDLVTGESNSTETSREFTGIKIWDEEIMDYEDAPQEVYDYYDYLITISPTITYSI